MYLTGDNVSKEKLLKIAQKCNLPVWPSENAPFLYQGDFSNLPDSVCVLTEELTDVRLQTLFQLPITVLIDANSNMKSIVDFIKQQKHHVFSDGLGFLLTGPVIYHFDVAQIFAKALQERQHFSDFRLQSIHLALHESLVNGLVHGNLRLSGQLRQNALQYQSYNDLIKERLNTPAFARKAVSIAAGWNRQKMKITVRDEGMGYSLSEILKNTPTIRSTSGRGLRIIAGAADSCTIENYGKEISLSFLREKPAKPDDISPMAATVHPLPHHEDLSRAKVLIMEDNQSNQALLAGLLSQLGIGKIDVAKDGVEGLNKVLSFEPDLIILDITMPKLDGYEVLKRLKSAPCTRAIPVLIQTASDTREARDKTFKAGASDFITKPINPLEFFARVRIHLENRLLVNRLQKRLKKIHSELSTAQNMQISLLPNAANMQEIEKKFGLQMAAHFEPSDKLGGDFWQTISLSRQRICFYMCDFSGHGLAAALNTFRLHTLIFQMRLHIDKPSGFLKEINRQLCILLQRGQFATFFAGIYDARAKTLFYSGAGSPSPFYYSGDKWRVLPVRGLPLGISPEAEYEDKAVSFQHGDRLFLYSDALTEAVNAQGERASEDQLLRFVWEETANRGVKEGLSEVINRFYSFAPRPVQDDITALLIEA